MCCGTTLFSVALMILPLSALAADPAATTVYRSVNVDGVVSFSDAPHPSAVPVEVIPPPPAPADEQQRAERMYQQQLELLEILEASRHARADEALAQQRLDLDYVRTEAALEGARASQEQHDEHYYPVYSYPGWFAPKPWPPMRPDRPGPLPERPVQQHVKLP